MNEYQYFSFSSSTVFNQLYGGTLKRYRNEMFFFAHLCHFQSKALQKFTLSREYWQSDFFYSRSLIMFTFQLNERFSIMLWVFFSIFHWKTICFSRGKKLLKQIWNHLPTKWEKNTKMRESERPESDGTYEYYPKSNEAIFWWYEFSFFLRKRRKKVFLLHIFGIK